MAIHFFKATPFNIANELDPCEVFIGDGTTKTFVLTKFSVLRVAESIQVGSLFFSRSSNPVGFTVNVTDNSVTLLSAPASGAKIVVTGTSAGVLNAFDVATAGTATSANIKEKIFYIGDVDEITYWSYGPLPGNTGIVVSLSDQFDTGGVDPEWLQFAPLLADGSIGTYGTAGESIDLGSLIAKDVVQSDMLAGDSVVTVADGSQFIEGRFLQFNPGGVTQETRQIINVTGDVLTLATGTDYLHDADELVYENIIGFGMKLTLPIGVTGGQAMNLYDCCLRRQLAWTSRM
jgi:hypothetical protein